MSLAEVMLECQAMIEPQAQKRGISMTFPRFDKPVLRQRRPDPGEAGSHQPAFQRDQVQQGAAERSSWTAPRARRNAFASASRTPARDCLRKSWRSCSSRSIGSDRRRSARGRHRHRPGGEQAAGRTDGRRRSAWKAPSASGSVFWFELNSAAAPQLAVDRSRARGDPDGAGAGTARRCARCSMSRTTRPT